MFARLYFLTEPSLQYYYMRRSEIKDKDAKVQSVLIKIRITNLCNIEDGRVKTNKNRTNRTCFNMYFIQMRRAFRQKIMG